MHRSAPPFLLVLLGAAACTTPRPASSTESDLTPWDDIDDDGEVSAQSLTTIATALEAHPKTAGYRLVAAHHQRDEGRFMRDEVVVDLAPVNESSRASALAVLRSSDEGWDFFGLERYVDGVEIDAGMSFADGQRALDVAMQRPEVAAHGVSPIWIGHGTAHGRISRPTCIGPSEIAVELEHHRPKTRADTFAVVCIDEDVSFSSWRPWWP